MENSKIQKHLALYDVHVPHNINLKPVVEFAKDYQPDYFIIGGDFLNLEFASHWNEALFKQIGTEKLGKMLRQEIAAGKEVLKEFAGVLPKNCKKYYIPGNHEEWLFWACTAFPELAGPVNLGVDRMTFKSDLSQIKKQALARLLTEFLETDKIGMTVLPYEKELNIGKITYIHGHQAGSLAAMKRNYPARNVVCGHIHTHEVTTQHNSGVEGRAHQYVIVPCLCHLSPGYLKSTATRWLNGFWIADVLPNGLFDGRVVKVLDGSIVYGNKIYK